MNRRWLLAAPLAAAGAAGLGFWAMLRGLSTGSYDPRGLPSALLGKPAPAFTLQPLQGEPFTRDLLAGNGRPTLVNFFASWCVPCIVEHPQLMALHREGVPIFGIAYRDKPADALGFLARRGNPYLRLGADPESRAAAEWGVTGVPETFLLDARGIVRWRWAGPIDEATLARDLRPMLARHA
jgi:cytochrome c biogenesis protein CcmG/thiol:disulfide interchange protein DsbE